jgi:hypothetical protein
MFDPKADLKKVLEFFNQRFGTDYLYIAPIENLYFGGEFEEDPICSLVDLKEFLIADDYIVLVFSSGEKIYLFSDDYEYEGDSPRSGGPIERR